MVFEARVGNYRPLPVDLRELHFYGRRASFDYQAKGYLWMRKTQQLHLAGVLILN